MTRFSSGAIRVHSNNMDSPKRWASCFVRRREAIFEPIAIENPRCHWHNISNPPPHIVYV